MAESGIFPRSELEQLQHEAGLVTDQSLESTRRMLTMMEETEEVGKSTIEALAVQGEQLNRIEDGMNDINTNMKNAKKSLRSLKRCCNICATPWKKVPPQEDNPIEFDDIDATKHNVISSQPRRDPNHIAEGKNPQSGYITRITNDAREDEMDANMGQVNNILDNLRNMAEDMSTELGKQNIQIDRLNEKGEDNAIRLAEVNITANSLLKS